MGCGPIEFLKGGTLQEATIEDSLIRDSVIRGSEIQDGHFTGHMTFDETALADLVAALLAALEGKPVNVDPEYLARIFTNCQGLPLIPGVQIATCQDLADALAASCCGQGGGGGGSGDTITAVTFNNNTRTLTISVALAAGGNYNWTVVIPGGGSSGGEGDTITDVQFDPATRALVITVLQADGTVFPWSTIVPGDVVTDLTFDDDSRELLLTVTAATGATVEHRVTISGGGGETVDRLDFNNSTRDLTLRVLDVDGVERDLVANVPTGAFEITPFGPAPMTTRDSNIPVEMFGEDRMAILGRPRYWGTITFFPDTDQEETLLFPLYSMPNPMP